MTADLFDVWQFFPDETHEKVGDHLPAKDAVELAKSHIELPAALIGTINRVIIVDDGDYTVFEWRFGEGVTFPPIGPS